jgi:YaiO family outer membrane protein
MTAPRDVHGFLCRISVTRLLTAVVVLGSPVVAAVADACGSAVGPGAETAPAERFRCAGTLAREGRFDAAAGVYAGLSAQFPDNVDYVFGEAQARFWSGDADRALERVSRARQLAPDYEDVWALELRILASASQHDQRRLSEFRRAARSRFPGAEWLKDEEVVAEAAWYWETGINRETLDNGADDWQSVYAHIDRRTPEDSVLSLTVTEHRRFSLSDIEVVVGGSVKLADTWLVDGALKLGPDATFLPETVVDAAIGRILGEGWIVGGGVGRRWYADDSVNTLGAHVERYFGRFRAALNVDNTRLDEASSFTYRAMLDYYTASGSRYGLTIAAGDEVEVVAPGQLLDMDISAVAISGRHPVGNRLSIAWRAGTHRQGSLYRRNLIGLSIAGEF